MKSKSLFLRAASVALIATVLAVLVAPVAVAEPDRDAKRRRGGFDLLRASSTFTLATNRVQCGLDSQGNDCTDVFGSPTGGGGFWPNGSPNQYIFNSGLQIAGIIPPDAGFDWAGDTVGAYIFDARGTQPQGEQLSLIYSSILQEDLDSWPQGAYIRDADIFETSLLGRKAISEEDSWVRYWDGNPNLLSGRTHPMGVMIDQRTLAWNFPSGNEDIVYFLYTFYNVTASDPSVYSGLCTPVPDSDLNCATVEAEIAAIGAEFQADNEARFGIDIPAGGYKFDSLFAAFAMDPDVGNAGVNASTAILPFQMGVAYKTDFNEPTWLYPAEINGPPFGPYPGFVGVKYLKSPVNPATLEPVGLSLFSNTTNGAPFPDPVGVSQLWRLLSGRISTAEGDLPCTIANPVQRRLCTLVQDPRDTRFFQSSGPFELNPGEAATIVVAFVHAAPVAAEVIPFVNGVLEPGISPSGTEIAADPGVVRVLERASGWLDQNDDNGDGEITQDEVTTLERSLLRKSLVAQTLFDGKFALPSPPDAPPFFLVPGDNQVTVVWQQSPTETNGDPFFAVAGDPASAAFDGNYRFNDVEGYRIWRGRSRALLVPIAQFDYAGTTFLDFTGGWDYGGQCAPELGITGGCPIAFDGVNSVAHDLVGTIQQVPPGGRVELADGSVITLTSNNSVEENLVMSPSPLSNTGVPFAFVDNSARNSVDYFYAVTAFDVNSIASTGAELTSLESSRQAQLVTPRAPSPNLVGAGPIVIDLVDRDGNVLNPGAAYPTIDGTTGIFSGPAPPTAALAPLAQEIFAGQLLDPAGGDAFIRIDSVVPQYYHDGTYYFSLLGPVPGSISFGVDLPLGEEDGASVFGPVETLLPADQTLAAQVGLEGIPVAAKVSAQLTVNAVTFTSKDADWHWVVEGAFFGEQDPPLNDDVGGRNQGGSRWFAGDNETMPDPTLDYGHGQLPDVNTIYAPAPYNFAANALARRNMQTSYHTFRAADIKVYWGTTPGTVDSVIDVTHNLPVPFNSSTNIGPYWGFRDDISGRSVTFDPADGIITEFDFGHGPCFPLRPSWSTPDCETRPYLEQAVLQPVDVNFDGAADGDGFAMMINGEFFIFQTAALPSNTVWTYRSYTGLVYQDGGGQYVYVPKPSNAPIPGLMLRARASTGASTRAVEAGDLDNVHTLPDPYYVTSGLEVTPSAKIIKFVNLPNQAIIRIYSVSGILVDVVEHNDPQGGGEVIWDVRNKNNQFVASGVYFYHVETATGQEKIGRFTVVNVGGLSQGQDVP